MAGDYERAALELWAEAGAPGAPLALQVTGGSMRPLLRPGDRVLLERAAPESLRPGDLLALRRGGEVVTHRLLAREGAALLTRGDAAPHPDPPFTAADVLGRAVAVERGGRSLDLQSRPWPALNPLLAKVARLETAAWKRGGRVLALPFTLALCGMVYIGVGWPGAGKW